MSQTIGSIVFGPEFKDFDRYFVGFDEQWNRMVKMHQDVAKNIPNYPPYNIKKVDEDHYVVEVAVAGFARSEIDIILEENKLTIKGASKDDASEDYLFKGIGMRDFTRTFMLNDHIEVRGADLVNGMLKVFLEHIIPESKKPKKIEIGEQSLSLPKSEKQLLTEGK